MTEPDRITRDEWRKVWVDEHQPRRKVFMRAFFFASAVFITFTHIWHAGQGNEAESFFLSIIATALWTVWWLGHR